MTCPCCGSVIIVQNPVTSGDGRLNTYEYFCTRCTAKIEIAVTLTKSGDPDLMRKYQDWLHER
jgi:DNA-directed RNA polymerase subunit RPC12/RpoP